MLTSDDPRSMHHRASQWRPRAHRDRSDSQRIRRVHRIRHRTIHLACLPTRRIPTIEHACDDKIMPAKFCLDCGELTRDGSRCADCQQERVARINSRRKRNTTARGLGHAHRVRAKAVVDAAQVCAICGRPPTPDDPLTADHIIPRSKGGTDGPLRAAHRSCNSRRGARLSAS